MDSGVLLLWEQVVSGVDNLELPSMLGLATGVTKLVTLLGIQLVSGVILVLLQWQVLGRGKYLGQDKLVSGGTLVLLLWQVLDRGKYLGQGNTTPGADKFG